MNPLKTNGAATTCLGAPRAAPRHGCAYLRDPDVQLMLQVQLGNDHAFDELQHRYTPRVFGYFCRLLRNREEAEDLTQDVFLRLYRSRNRYQPRARFGTWLYHITQNAARNALRLRGRRAALRIVERPPLEGLLVDPVAPSASLERDEQADVLRAAIAGLAGRQRTAVEMHLRGCTCAEMAAEMDVSPEAAKSLLHRARLRLRDALSPVVG